MPRKTKRTKRIKNPEQCDQWRVRKTSRKCYTPIQQAEMITLKKKGYTDRQIADKLDINQRVINKTYKRVVDRSLKLQVPLNNPRCYEYKITPHAKLVTQKKAERIVKKIISTTENRRKSAVQHIKEMNLKDLKYDRYGTDLNDEHKRKRLNFALKYKDFDWKRRCVSSDEAKIKEKEHYNKKV
ncbi:MAG: hypothetical protein HETSPECPRED_003044 [Heterodermia speciosa]|uniref:Uncharacterized protein n=1 Tax=Heterodermia speciosa TaxID=116794 RepID=A0A8H3J5V0_9LECA|nr:MAG: hypothetical protein HETSPECPRED_003044 [Heterodermia speciosa]